MTKRSVDTSNIERVQVDTLLTSKEQDQGPHIHLDSEGQPVEVIYTYLPRYPVLGEKQSVFTVLGSTKEASTVLIQRAFPQLAKYPPDRIEFLLPINDITYNLVAENGVVMEEVWFKLIADPPEVLLIQLRDGPGDEANRIKVQARTLQRQAQAIKREDIWAEFKRNYLDGTLVVICVPIGLFLFALIARFTFTGKVFE